jgi:Leucine-rich repeat (LRR) protein
LVDSTLWVNSRPRVVLPDGFFTVPSCGFNLVRTLDVSYKDLTSIPSTIEALTNLERADFSYNNLESLPTTMTKLSKLQYLFLSGNGVATSLDWSNCNFSIFPGRFIKLMSNLETLDLSNNKLTSMESLVNHSLLNLNLAFNEFSSFPFSVENDANLLESLNLSNNSISTIPLHIFNASVLSSLYELDLSSNLITSVSYHWAIWSNAKTGKILHLAYNSIHELDWGLVSTENNTEISSFPLKIDEIAENIEWINLHSQKLGNGKIPSDIAYFVNLKRLELTNMDFNQLPKSFCNLTKLEYMDLSPNALAFYESSDAPFCDFPSLKVLNISYSKNAWLLESVPRWIIPELEVLNLSNFRMHSPTSDFWRLPFVLSSHPNLQVLDLSGSYLDNEKSNWAGFQFPQNYSSLSKPGDMSDADWNSLPNSWSNSSLQTLLIKDLVWCVSDNACNSVGFGTHHTFNSTDYQDFLTGVDFLSQGFN